MIKKIIQMNILVLLATILFTSCQNNQDKSQSQALSKRIAALEMLKSHWVLESCVVLKFRNIKTEKEGYALFLSMPSGVTATFLSAKLYQDIGELKADLRLLQNLTWEHKGKISIDTFIDDSIVYPGAGKKLIQLSDAEYAELQNILNHNKKNTRD